MEVAILSAIWPKIKWHCSRADVESKLSGVLDCVASIGGAPNEEAGGAGPADNNDDGGGGGSTVGGDEPVCSGGDAEVSGGG